MAYRYDGYARHSRETNLSGRCGYNGRAGRLCLGRWRRQRTNRRRRDGHGPRTHISVTTSSEGYGNCSRRHRCCRLKSPLLTCSPTPSRQDIVNSIQTTSARTGPSRTRPGRRFDSRAVCPCRSASSVRAGVSQLGHARTGPGVRSE